MYNECNSLISRLKITLDSLFYVFTQPFHLKQEKTKGQILSEV